MMAEFRRQAERFGTEFITDDVTRVDFSERPHRVWVGDDEYRAETVIVATGATARQLGLRLGAARSRAAASRTARPATRAFFRDQRPRGRRRRRLRDGGGDVPDALRDEGDDRAPARRVPRLADHARPRPREREDRVRHATPWSTRCSATTARHGRPPRDATRTRRASSTADGVFVGDRPRPEHGALPRPARPRRDRLPGHEAALDGDERRRVSSRSATCRTTCTGRPSPRPVPAVWARSTPSGIWPHCEGTS